MGLEDRDFRADLRSLCHGWREVHKDAQVDYMQDRDGREVAPVVYGLTAHVYYLAEAALALDAEGRSTAAIPLVRLALECAVTAAWVELGGTVATRALMAEEVRTKDLTLKNFEPLDYKLSEDEQDRFDKERAEFSTYTAAAGRNFAARCSEIRIGAYMYAIYRVASTSSHAGIKVSDRYIHSRQEGITLSPEPRDDGFDNWTAQLVAIVLVADLALCRLGRRVKRRTRLKALAAVYRVPERAEWTNQGYVAQRQRERTYKEQRRSRG